MKNIISLLMICLLFAFTFIGCSKKDNTTLSNQSADDTTPKDISSSDLNATPTNSVSPTTTASEEALTGSNSTYSDNFSKMFKDGTYEVETLPDAENYYTTAIITIEDGKITDFKWDAYDKSRDNLIFDENYYVVMSSEEYVQQCKDDWAGSRDYTDMLLTNQNINEVDGVSGATWSYIKFSHAVNTALSEAAKDVTPIYLDGVYEGVSHTDVDGYYSKATITIEGGKITSVDWNVYDANRKDAVFDADYYKQIIGWEGGQCQSNFNLSRDYSSDLLEKQDINKVDAVSGATYMNVKFKQAVNDALAPAYQ